MFGVSGFSREGNFNIGEELIPFLSGIRIVGDWKYTSGNNSETITYDNGVSHNSSQDGWYYTRRLAFNPAVGGIIYPDEKSISFHFFQPMEFGGQHSSFHGSASTAKGGGWFRGGLDLDFNFWVNRSKTSLNTLYGGTAHTSCQAILHSIGGGWHRSPKMKVFSFHCGAAIDQYYEATDETGYGLNVYNDNGDIINSTQRGKMLDVKQILEIPISKDVVDNQQGFNIDPSIVKPAMMSFGSSYFPLSTQNRSLQAYIDSNTHQVKLGMISSSSGWPNTSEMNTDLNTLKQNEGKSTVTCWIIDGADYE